MFIHPSSHRLSTVALESPSNGLRKRLRGQLRSLDGIVKRDPDGAPDLLELSDSIWKPEMLQAAVDGALDPALRHDAHHRRRRSSARDHDPERLVARLSQILLAPRGRQRMAPGIKVAQVVRMDDVPRAVGDDGVVGLCGVLDGRAGGEAAGGAVVGLEVVAGEEGGRFGGGGEGAGGWADEFLGFFGDEAADGVAEEELFLWVEGCFLLWCLGEKMVCEGDERAGV